LEKQPTVPKKKSEEKQKQNNNQHTNTMNPGREGTLKLYRSILQAHKRHLPQEMRQLGDAYVKQEFKLHKDVTKPEQLTPFFTAWQDYLQQILKTARVQETVATGSLDAGAAMSQQTFGKDLPADMELSQEQLDQLQKLKEQASSGGGAAGPKS
jgi:hypothetical protein